MTETRELYRDYLARFGIRGADERIVERRDLDAGDVRFFALAHEQDLRWRAALTPRGLVAPARRDDDWFGFLSSMPDARAAADRIAWLTASPTPVHTFPVPPSRVVLPGERVPGADPAAVALVEQPSLRRDGDSLVLTMWILPAGPADPERWQVVASPATSAVTVEPASTMLAERETAADRIGRARCVLVSGSIEDRRWALDQVGAEGDMDALDDVAALLAGSSVDAEVRVIAAATLGRIGDARAVVSLRSCMETEGDPAVRRACAHALGRIGGGDARAALTEVWPRETDAVVRAEIDRALEATADDKERDR